MIETTSAEIAASILITWFLALLAPLLVRYAFARKPLSWETAFQISLAWSVVGWISFRILNGFAGAENLGSGAVWVAAFFVNRWLLNRGKGDAPLKEKRTLKQRLFGLPTWEDSPPKKRMEDTEMIEGLQRVIADERTPDDIRARASEQLATLRRRASLE